MTRKLRLLISICGIVVASTLAARGDDAADHKAREEEFFEKEVRPILVERCAKCHTGEKPKGGLRLSSRAEVLKGGDTGPAAVAGMPEESLLVQAIRYDDEPKMPPKQKLPDREIAALDRWVAAGLPWPEAKAIAAAPRSAPYQITEAQRGFWSFQPLPQTPVPVPLVNDTTWIRGEIDRFVLAKLEAKGLRPAPRADKATLLRRATFDLTGLPPTTEELTDLLADESPEAFDRVIDRLLASPRYGERWGRHWLDIVRYADSRDARGIGGADDITEAYRYRDWVVRAFNRDLPYDQFIRDQVAGDLLPPEPGKDFNDEGLVATGLLAIGEWGTGDADKEKMVTDIVDDQIDVVGRAFLGLTLACARCHDHKFDPIPQADYYGLAGIFFSTHILPDPGAKTAGSPLLRTPMASRERVEALARHKERTAALEKKLKEESEAASLALAERLLPETDKYLLAAWDLTNAATVAGNSAPQEKSQRLTELARQRGLRPFAIRQWLAYLGMSEGRPLANLTRDLRGVQGVWNWSAAPEGPSLTINTTRDLVTQLTYKLPPLSVSVHPAPTKSVAAAWQSPVAATVRLEGLVADGDPVGGDGVAWSVVVRTGSGSARTVAAGDVPNGGSHRLGKEKADSSLGAIEVKPGDRILLVVSPKGSHTCDTTTLEMSVALADGSTHWDLTSDLLTSPQAGGSAPDQPGIAGVWHVVSLDDAGRSSGGFEGSSPLGRWQQAGQRAKEGRLDREELAKAAAEVRAALVDGEGSGPGKALRSELLAPRGPFWTTDEAELLPEARSSLAEQRQQLEDHKAKTPPPIPLALAAQEGGVPKSAHEGFADTRIHIRGSYMRLGDNVPRHFPRIVAGDEPAPIISGTSGRLELAEWLSRADNPLTARVMVNRIWQYHFGEGLVRTPSNFGKLGQPPTHPELLDYLAQRFIAGGWSIKAMHGAIMKSAAYQQAATPPAATLAADPENRLFGRLNRRRLEAEEIRDSLLAVAGKLDLAAGGPSYRDFNTARRTLYLMTIRSDRSSFGPLFDAADSTAIVDTRTTSIVAPQALFLLNGPFALEAARALAARVQGQGPGGDREKIQYLYRLLYSRAPSEQELALGLEALKPNDAENHGGPGGKRWVSYCHVLLCTNEFLFVD